MTHDELLAHINSKLELAKCYEGYLSDNFYGIIARGEK